VNKKKRVKTLAEIKAQLKARFEVVAYSGNKAFAETVQNDHSLLQDIYEALKNDFFGDENLLDLGQYTHDDDKYSEESFHKMLNHIMDILKQDKRKSFKYIALNWYSWNVLRHNVRSNHDPAINIYERKVFGLTILHCDE